MVTMCTEANKPNLSPKLRNLLHFQNELALHNICKIVVQGGQRGSWKGVKEFIKMYSVKLCAKYEAKGHLFFA